MAHSTTEYRGFRVIHVDWASRADTPHYVTRRANEYLDRRGVVQTSATWFATEDDAKAAVDSHFGAVPMYGLGEYRGLKISRNSAGVYAYFDGRAVDTRYLRSDGTVGDYSGFHEGRGYFADEAAARAAIDRYLGGPAPTQVVGCDVDVPDGNVIDDFDGFPDGTIFLGRDDLPFMKVGEDLWSLTSPSPADGTDFLRLPPPGTEITLTVHAPGAPGA